jgi:hypothetical protein
MVQLYLTLSILDLVAVIFRVSFEQICPSCYHGLDLPAAHGLHPVKTHVHILHQAISLRPAPCFNPDLLRDQVLTMTISIVFPRSSRLVLGSTPLGGRFKCH